MTLPDHVTRKIFDDVKQHGKPISYYGVNTETWDFKIAESDNEYQLVGWLMLTIENKNGQPKIIDFK